METTNEVFGYMEECIAKKRGMGKESTADLYRAGSNWLKMFCADRIRCLGRFAICRCTYRQADCKSA